jgi:hypothetical protein
MSKRMYDMDENELRELIRNLEHKVAKLNHERPGSAEYRHESSVLEDAKQLLAEKQQK